MGLSKMIKTILGAAIVSVALASSPASARGTGCDAGTLTKVGTTLDIMADGPNKMAAAHEVTLVNDAIMKGDMHACAIHVRKAEELESKPGI